MEFIVPVIYLAIIVLMIASQWKIYTKAGKPGWAAIVPIYNIIVLMEIVGRPTWWVILFFVPCVNFVIQIMVIIDLAKSFGKTGGFAAGMILLGVIFYPMLAFGDSKYIGPAAAAAAGAAPPQGGGQAPPPAQA